MPASSNPFYSLSPSNVSFPITNSTAPLVAPSSDPIVAINTGPGLSGGGSSGVITIFLNNASTSALGGVIIGSGLSVSSGLVSVAQASSVTLGGSRLATSAEVIIGADTQKIVTPATLAKKTATLTQPGIVTLSDTVTVNDSTKAATQTAAKTAYDAGVNAQLTANAALPKAGGTMTGVITFAPAQTFPGVSLPLATTTSPGVVQVGSGLNISVGGILSTLNNGTVTAVTAGAGLGAPVTGNIISTSGTIRLLPPTTDGLQLGGVKQGANIAIAVDGTISVPSGTFLSTNNPYAFDAYVWPIPDSFGFLPGTNGQVLTVLDKTAGTVGWTNTGTLTTVAAGTGLSVASTATTATVSLATVPSVVPGTVGATGLIPTFNVNQFGQVTSTGLANAYSPFQIASVSAPPLLLLDFGDNNTNWEWTLLQNTTFSNPLNAQSGQTGCILLTQNAGTPYVVTWGSAWKFAGGVPYSGNPVVATKDLIQFVVVNSAYIVVTNVIQNLG